jgi:hypothetical protein
LSTLLDSVPKRSGTELTDREYEAPLTHVEREGVSHGYHDNSDDEPDQRKAPEQEADYQADKVECFPSLSLPIEDKGLESKPLKCSTNLGFRVSIFKLKPLLFSSRDLCLNELEIS